MHQPPDLRFRRGIHHPDSIRQVRQTAFEQFDGFDHDDALLGTRHQGADRLTDDRMHDGFQFGQRFRVGKDNLPQQGAVNALIRPEDKLAEGIDNGFVGWRAGLHRLMSQSISINRVCTQML